MSCSCYLTLSFRYYYTKNSLNMNQTEPPKKSKTEKKPADIKEYIPSPSAYGGEILVKGKTLGRWATKQFILDPDNRMFILKRTNPKKKWKMFDLRKYSLENQEKRKDRFTFDLDPLSSGDKKLSLGTTNEKVLNQVVQSLTVIFSKNKQQSPDSGRLSITARKSMLIEKSMPQITSNPTSDDDESPQKVPLPDHFNSIDIMNNLVDNHLDEQYEMNANAQYLTILKHKNSHTLFKAQLTFSSNIPDIVLYHLLTNFNYIQQWNQFVTPNSRVVRTIFEEKAVLIHEQRLYLNLYPFPREFVFLRHARQQDERILIFDKSVDAIDVKTRVPKGILKFAIWKIFRVENQLKLLVTVDSSNNGFSFQEEDGFFTSHFLSQLEGLNPFINKNLEALLKDKTLQENPFQPLIKPKKVEPPKEEPAKLIQKEEQKEQGNDMKEQFKGNELKEQFKGNDLQLKGNDPKEQLKGNDPKEQVKANDFKQEVKEEQKVKEDVLKPSSPQKPQTHDDDAEFYDCDEVEYEQMSQMLHVESRKSIYQEIGEAQEEQDPQPPKEESEWTMWKMQLFKTGEYHSYNIRHKYGMVAEPRQEHQQLLQLPEGMNFLYRDDWLRDDSKGGLKMINQAKINAQKKVLKFLLKRIGTNLLSGKSMMHVSMPVDIFESRSNTERICNGLGFAPIFLERAAKSNDPVQRVQDVLAFSLGFLVNFLSMEKPFNPILGETYQGFLDRCPVYAEQVSHHPPICAFLLYGRGYRMDGRLETIANLHSNSVVGKNVGQITIRFQDQTVRVLLAPGLITGTAFGDRMFWFTGKQHCIDVDNHIFAEVVCQPDKKFCSQLNIKHQAIGDYLCGGVYRVTPQASQRYMKDGFKKYGSEIGMYQIHRPRAQRDQRGPEPNRGSMDKRDPGTNPHTSEQIDQQTLFDVLTHVPCSIQHDPYPLASDANYRMDLLWWKVRDFDQAQHNKEQMELLQRQDKKLREAKGGSKH